MPHASVQRHLRRLTSGRRCSIPQLVAAPCCCLTGENGERTAGGAVSDRNSITHVRRGVRIRRVTAAARCDRRQLVQRRQTAAPTADLQPAPLVVSRASRDSQWAPQPYSRRILSVCSEELSSPVGASATLNDNHYHETGIIFCPAATLDLRSDFPIRH